MEKMLKARAKREAREQKILEGYKAKFEKRKARKERKAKEKEQAEVQEA